MESRRGLISDPIFDEAGKLLNEKMSTANLMLVSVEIIIALAVVYGMWKIGSIVASVYAKLVRLVLTVRDEDFVTLTFATKTANGTLKTESIQFPIASDGVMAVPEALDREDYDVARTERQRRQRRPNRRQKASAQQQQQTGLRRRGVATAAAATQRAVYSPKRKAERELRGKGFAELCLLWIVETARNILSPHRSSIAVHELLIRTAFGALGVMYGLRVVNLNMMQLLVLFGISALYMRSQTDIFGMLINNWITGLIMNATRECCRGTVLEYNGSRKVIAADIGTFRTVLIDVTSKADLFMQHKRTITESVKVVTTKSKDGEDTTVSINSRVSASAAPAPIVGTIGSAGSDSDSDEEEEAIQHLGLVRYYIVNNSDLFMRTTGARWALYYYDDLPPLEEDGNDGDSKGEDASSSSDEN
jgi:hypothetical protein